LQLKLGRAAATWVACGPILRMCGIVGFWQAQAPREQSLGILKAMGSRLLHRGPDADGEFLDEDAGLGLGHRRLSILDLSPEGRQPMVSTCGRYVIAYNGEIYNYRQLRQEL